LWNLEGQFWVLVVEAIGNTEKWVKFLTLANKIHFNVEYQRIQLQIQRGIPRQNRYPITQVMESRSKGLGSQSENHLNYGKIEHENGLQY